MVQALAEESGDWSAGLARGQGKPEKLQPFWLPDFWGIFFRGRRSMRPRLGEVASG